jgi:hypothetical protein
MISPYCLWVCASPPPFVARQRLSTVQRQRIRNNRRIVGHIYLKNIEV